MNTLPSYCKEDMRDYAQAWANRCNEPVYFVHWTGEIVDKVEPNMSKENADIMRRAYELAPFIADALRELADEVTLSPKDERDWTHRERSSHLDAVTIAEALIRQDSMLLGMHTMARIETLALDLEQDAHNHDT